MANILLTQLLDRVKQSDLENFKKKILPQEEAKEAEFKARGVKNIRQLQAEHKAKLYNLDYNDMGTETNIDGEVPVPPVAKEPSKDTPEGKQAFEDFMEQLK